MITLLLLAQITREEFLDFKKQAEIQFVRIDERFNKIEAEIQTLNQRINYTNERIDDFISFIRILSGILMAITLINLALVSYLILYLLYYKERKS
jgi:hypothetical protein